MSAGPPLRVVVVGGGLGGLAAAARLRLCGHHVTVLEQAPRFGPVGGGIQLAPNATAFLRPLGVLDVVGRWAVRAETSMRRRYEDGRLLGRYELGESVVERFGAPYLHVQRADLHDALARVALADRPSAGAVSLELGVQVCGVEQPGGGPALVVTRDGRRLEADVVLGADGIHSRLRGVVTSTEEPSFSGDVAHRCVVPVRSLSRRAELDELDELTRDPSLTIWLGPGRHLVHYFVHGRELLNLVLCAPAGTDEIAESWSADGSVEEMVAALDGWDARAVALVSLARSVHRTGLYDREPLETWVEGRLALLGDACHPMLPYQAQGAAQAFEDAAALAEELEGIEPDGVPAALVAYQARRQPRAAAVQLASRLNRQLFHLPDGAEQRRRDERLGTGAGDFDSYAWIWTTPTREEAR